MTNVNRTYGNFASGMSEAFMVLNRNYQMKIGSDENTLIDDLTTYIDPIKAKINQIPVKNPDNITQAEGTVATGEAIKIEDPNKIYTGNNVTLWVTHTIGHSPVQMTAIFLWWIVINSLSLIFLLSLMVVFKNMTTVSADPIRIRKAQLLPCTVYLLKIE